MFVFAQLKGMLDLVERDVLQVGHVEVASGRDVEGGGDTTWLRRKGCSQEAGVHGTNG